MGMLAVGLSTGVALAATPQIASADSSADPFSWAGNPLEGSTIDRMAVDPDWLPRLPVWHFR